MSTETGSMLVDVAEHTIFQAPRDALDHAQEMLPDDLSWARASLPDRQSARPAPPGMALVSVHRMAIVLETVPERGLGVYVPNFAGARIALYANGARVDGSPAAASDPGRFPWLFMIPGALLRQGENMVSIAIQAEARFTIVSRVHVGDPSVLRKLYATREWLTRTGPEIACITIVIAGCLVFAFWLGRRAETAYLFYSCSAALWALRTSHYFFDALPLDSRWYWWAVLNTLPWMMAFVYLFALRIHGQRFPRLESVLILSAIVLSLATLPGLGSDMWGVYDIAYNLQLVLALGMTVLITRLAWRRRNVASMTLTFALWINLGLGLNDLLAKSDYTYLQYEGTYLMPYGALLLFASLSAGAILRFLSTLDEVETLNRSLERRVRDKTAEVEDTYRQLAVAERERVTADERARIMREMHDGLGSSLMTSLKMVERGRLGSDEIATVLRECIDDLRLIIDSLEPIDHDLVALLATLRYRLGQRLEAAGIRFEWRVGDIPILPWLDQSAALQIMRTVQEVLTNALKHAEAKMIWAETGVADGRVFVRVSDDGHGFNVAEQLANGHGRGLRNLQRRADAIGGAFDIGSGPGGTVATLWLPIEREPRGPTARPAVADAANRIALNATLVPNPSVQ